jgi:2-polyprenyl-3-methyl-5-hydroxy-6-metoxy-1,4-benzoquinol methylase
MILSFSQLGQSGRLGNQIFQVASTLGLAETHGAQAVFPAWAYEPYFETPIPHGTMQTAQVVERFFHHHDWELTDSCDLVGYLQSEKYFGSTRLALKQSFVAEQKAKFPEIFERETIVLQVRRGDYVGNPNYYQLPAVFYLDALVTYFPNWQECNLLITSDDLEYCRVQFEGLPNAYFPEGLSDIESMALASACDHFIISNSTFGWWCAWLGEKKHSKIVHSGHLFAGKLLRKDARDFRPDRWTAHHKDSYKIPLRDLTFTIPVHFDHATRKENLDLALYMLQKDFDSNYIVCEQGGDHFKYTAQWATYMQSDSPEFHRTKMLNDMATRARTPFLANWDCDVILPPAQLLVAVELLRAGADMVYPYDGRFARMRRDDWFRPIQQAADIGIVRDTAFKGREPDHNSVGGAVLWNKDSFIDGGMENEHFISFGPEDCERHDRFKTLGYDIRRVSGALFHMNHFVGANSSPRNPRFEVNVAEQEKVHNMTHAELRAYVDTWPWHHPYTSRYYHAISEGSIRSAKIVMEALPFRPASIVDVGCGVGEWHNGHPDYTGIDFRVKPDDLLIDPARFVEVDLNRALPDLGRRFDLCICLEVAEHLKPGRAGELVRFLCTLSDRVLFSAAIPHQGGTGHINERWQSWWAEIFAGEGFGAASEQPDVRHCEPVELWYRQNIVLYEKGARGKVEDFVLPAYYLQIVEALRP